MRGATYIEGFHDYTIKRGGVVICPRLVAAQRRATLLGEAAVCGISRLDALWGGGLDRGTGACSSGRRDPGNRRSLWLMRLPPRSTASWLLSTCSRNWCLRFPSVGRP